MRCKLPVVLQLLWISLASLVHAQEASVSMKIDLVAWGDQISGLSLKAGSGKGTITARSFSYSTPVAYSGPAIMEIHQSGSGETEKLPEPTAEDKEHQSVPLLEPESDDKVGDDGKPKLGIALELEKRREKDPTLVALAVLPKAGCRRATVLLGAAGGGTFTAYVIDDDPTKLPLDQLRVHNLAPVPISLRCNGNVTKELNTRGAMIVPAMNGQVIYELAYKIGDEWKMFESNLVAVRKNEQTQMIILRSKNSFFRSSDGSNGGSLQVVLLRRQPSAE